MIFFFREWKLSTELKKNNKTSFKISKFDVFIQCQKCKNKAIGTNNFEILKLVLGLFFNNLQKSCNWASEITVTTHLSQIYFFPH